MAHIHIITPGVKTLLDNIKPHKATGPDAVPACLLKTLSSALTPTLAHIYRTSLNEGTVPDDWKVAHVVPILRQEQGLELQTHVPYSDSLKDHGAYNPF